MKKWRIDERKEKKKIIVNKQKMTNVWSSSYESSGSAYWIRPISYRKLSINKSFTYFLFYFRSSTSSLSAFSTPVVVVVHFFLHSSCCSISFNICLVFFSVAYHDFGFLPVEDCLMFMVMGIACVHFYTLIIRLFFDFYVLFFSIPFSLIAIKMCKPQVYFKWFS